MCCLVGKAPLFISSMWNGNAACARTLTRHGTRRVSNDVYFVPRREPRAAPVVNHCTGLGTCDTCGGAQCPAKDDMKVTSTWRAAADRRQQRAGSRLAGIAASRQAARRSCVQRGLGVLFARLALENRIDDVRRIVGRQNRYRPSENPRSSAATPAGKSTFTPRSTMVLPSACTVRKRLCSRHCSPIWPIRTIGNPNEPEIST